MIGIVVFWGVVVANLLMAVCLFIEGLKQEKSSLIYMGSCNLLISLILGMLGTFVGFK